MKRILLLTCTLLGSVWAQTKTIEVQPGGGWVDTGIDLQAGDSVHFSATGTLQYSNAKQSNGPEGLSRGFGDLVRIMQVNDAGRGALVGRIGDSEADRAFLIGPKLDRRAAIAGRLYIAINQSSKDQATGSFQVSIARTAAPAAAAKADAKVPDFPQSLLDSIPLRVSDPNGAPGDRVNFILIGSKAQMQAALKEAGWVTVDSNKKEAFLQGFLDSMSKEAYVTMPMSELRLFGRPQDYGYAQGDPIRVVASRHHFRIWKAPFDLEGQTVWVGAGTHDVGFDRDQRNNGITHKIDPATDGERDYIRDNLTQTGMVLKSVYLTPKDAILKAKTATGEEFTSDGRTLIVYLAPPEAAN